LELKMAFKSFTKRFDDGRIFTATDRIKPADAFKYPVGIKDDDALRTWVYNCYQKSFSAMVPEFARMRMNERFYSGFHYLNPNDNFNNEITNYAFSIVETVWPELVTERPRPVIRPRFGSIANYNRIQKHQKLASWCMDITGFDRYRRHGMRSKLKYGWNVALMVGDPRTGLPFPKHWSNWHYMPNPSATKPENAMYHFLAGPVARPTVEVVFGRKVKPDDFASPGYQVLIQNYYDYYAARDIDGYTALPWVTSATSQDTGLDGEPAAIQTGDVWLVPGNGQTIYGADTVFLSQMVFRDLSKMKVAYMGTWRLPSGIQHEGIWEGEEPMTESGWRVATIAADGTVLQCKELDAAWGGPGIVIGHDYEHEDRYFGFGELDHVLSKIRAINRQYHLLDEASQFELLPIILRDQDSATDLHRGNFMPGDTVTKKHGSEVKTLDVNGIGPHQFAMLERRMADVDVVSGVHDVQQGQRPAGIEAAAAIRSLMSQALKRTNAKLPQLLDEMAQIVKCQLGYMSRKLDGQMMAMARDGEELPIRRGEFEYEFDLSFDIQSATAAGKMLAAEELFALYDRGIVDEQYVIEQQELPGAKELIQRAMQRRQEEMQVQLIAALAGAKENAGGSKGGGAKPKSSSDKGEMSKSRKQTAGTR